MNVLLNMEKFVNAHPWKIFWPSKKVRKYDFKIYCTEVHQYVSKNENINWKEENGYSHIKLVNEVL